MTTPRLAPLDDRARARLEAWLAWQVRVPFTYANGAVKLAIDLTDYGKYHLLIPRVLVTPPPEAKT